jgi:hypothetical protein
MWQNHPDPKVLLLTIIQALNVPYPYHSYTHILEKPNILDVWMFKFVELEF